METIRVEGSFYLTNERRHVRNFFYQADAQTTMDYHFFVPEHQAQATHEPSRQHHQQRKEKSGNNVERTCMEEFKPDLMGTRKMPARRSTDLSKREIGGRWW